MARTVADAMTANPRVLPPSATVVEASKLMLEEDIGAVPIVDGNGPIGIVTDRDIVLRVVAAGRDPSRTRLEEIATDDLLWAPPDESLEKASARMAVWRVRRMPVVEEDRVVGILAQADLAHQLSTRKIGSLVERISRREREPMFSVSGEAES